DSRIPATSPSTASAFAPSASAARADSTSRTRAMIAIPSPSEMRWLSRRDPGTCLGDRIDVHDQAVPGRLPPVPRSQPEELVVGEPIHLLHVREHELPRRERPRELEAHLVARLAHRRL